MYTPVRYNVLTVMKSKLYREHVQREKLCVLSVIAFRPVFKIAKSDY